MGDPLDPLPPDIRRVNTFSRHIELTAMEMALIEFFCSHYVQKNGKMPLFPLFSCITVLHLTFLGVRSKFLGGEGVVDGG